MCFSAQSPHSLRLAPAQRRPQRTSHADGGRTVTEYVTLTYTEERPQAEQEPELLYDVPMSDELQRHVREQAEQQGVPFEIAIAVIERESSYQRMRSATPETSASCRLTSAITAGSTRNSALRM